MFSCEFCKKIFFTEHLQTTASVYCKKKLKFWQTSLPDDEYWHMFSCIWKAFQYFVYVMRNKLYKNIFIEILLRHQH